MSDIIFDDATWEFQCGSKAPVDLQMMLNQWRHQFTFIIVMCESGIIDGTSGGRIQYVIARKPLTSQ